VLTSGQAGSSYNFAEFKPVTISGTVYQDLNLDGTNDPGDPGVAGVVLTLTGTNGAGHSVTATTTTAADGTYNFDTSYALLPGTYTITETQPSGYFQGTNDVGTVNGTAKGQLVGGTAIGSIVLTSGQSGINYNFGQIPPVSLSGTVFLDANNNGVQDSGETGIAGVTLTLTGTTALGQAVTVTTTTDANGNYSFTTDGSGNLLYTGSYQIDETPPSGYVQGTTTVGTINGETAGNLNSATEIGSINTSPGAAGINYNFAEITPVSIKGTVYKDNNTNRVKDTGDTVVSGVDLNLIGTNNQGATVTATATTDANGNYTFSTDSSGNLLMPGTYQVTETTPTGYAKDAANVGTVNGSSVGTAITTGSIGSIVLANNQNGMNYNFGLVTAATVSGYVYNDVNSDKVFDSGDAGLIGKTVNLTGTDMFGNTVSLTTTTNSSGYYSFAAMLPGTYVVSIPSPGTVYTSDAINVGKVSGSTDGVASTTGLAINTIVLHLGDTGVNYNFGFTRNSNPT
jgi:hypothetical protein